MKVKNLEKLIRILQGIVCVTIVLYSLALILIKNVPSEIKYFVMAQIIFGVLLLIILESSINTMNTTSYRTIKDEFRKTVLEFYRWLREKRIKRNK